MDLPLVLPCESIAYRRLPYQAKIVVRENIFSPLCFALTANAWLRRSMPKRQVKPDGEMKSALGEPLSTAPGYYTISPPDLNGLYTKEDAQPRRHA